MLFLHSKYNFLCKRLRRKICYYRMVQDGKASEKSNLDPQLDEIN